MKSQRLSLGIQKCLNRWFLALMKSPPFILVCVLNETRHKADPHLSLGKGIMGMCLNTCQGPCPSLGRPSTPEAQAEAEHSLCWPSQWSSCHPPLWSPQAAGTKARLRARHLGTSQGSCHLPAPHLATPVPPALPLSRGHLCSAPWYWSHPTPSRSPLQEHLSATLRLECAPWLTCRHHHRADVKWKWAGAGGMSRPTGA